jgi:hypothetical protein
MPLAQARDRAMHHVRAVKGDRYLVEGDHGKPWVASNDAVRELSAFERVGLFDDPLPHNAARLKGCELLTTLAGEALASVFSPLFTAAAPVPYVPEQG